MSQGAGDGFKFDFNFNSGGGGGGGSYGAGSGSFGYDSGGGGGYNQGGSNSYYTGGQSTGSSYYTNSYTSGGSSSQWDYRTGWQGSGGSARGTSFKWGSQFVRNEVREQLEELFHSYRSNNKLCRFQRWFFNSVKNPENYSRTVQAVYTKYKGIVNKTQFQDAHKRNPRPRTSYPIPCRSAERMVYRTLYHKDRIAMYNKQLDNNRILLGTMEKRCFHVQKRIDRVKMNQLNLSTRIMKIIGRVEILSQHGISIRGKDIVLRNQLKGIQRQLNKPDQFFGKVNELRPKVQNFVSTAPTVENIFENIKLYSRDKKKIRLFFKEQTIGLEKLINVLEQDLKDVNMMIRILDQRKKKMKEKNNSRKK